MASIASYLHNCVDPVLIPTPALPSMPAGDCLPPVSVEYGLVHDASGSVLLRIGSTEAVCSIFGPRVESSGGSIFSDIGRIEVDVKYSSFATPPANRMFAPPDSDSFLSERLVEALNATVCRDKYPKCTISIYVVITQSCGNELSTALAACSLALVDAAIEIVDIIAPCTVLIRDNEAHINPMFGKKNISDVALTASYSPALDSFPHVYLKGRVDVNKMKDLLEIAKKGSLLMRKELSASIRAKVLETV
jgi:ribonuclease PH